MRSRRVAGSFQSSKLTALIVKGVPVTKLSRPGAMRRTAARAMRLIDRLKLQSHRQRELALRSARPYSRLPSTRRLASFGLLETAKPPNAHLSSPSEFLGDDPHEGLQQSGSDLQWQMTSLLPSL